MSADKWDVCPRCLDEALKKKVADAAAAEAAYGVIPREEYADLLLTAEALVNLEATFRQDYEFYGASEGTLTISYGGTCTECGLTLSIQEKREFYKSEGESDG